MEPETLWTIIGNVATVMAVGWLYFMIDTLNLNINRVAEHTGIAVESLRRMESDLRRMSR